MIHYLVPRAAEFGIREYLDFWGKAVAPRVSVLHYEDLPRRTSLPRGTYIFSALDQLSAAGCRVVEEIGAQLVAGGPEVRVLNRPGASLLRFDLLAELHRRGLNRHRVMRAGGDLSGLRFPVFLREEHRHTGPISPLLATAEELEREVGRALMRGFRLEDLLAVEFCDTADALGFYRKYAAFCVAGEIIPRGLAWGRGWALKFASSLFTAEMFLEERAYVLENPHEARLREIVTAAGIDYGRIDYALKDGVVETWEINLNPTIGRGRRPPSGVVPVALQPLRLEARGHFYSRFAAALEAVDCSGRSREEVPIRYRPGTLVAGAPLTREVSPPRRFGLIRALLRPFRPLIDPLVRRLQPVIGRAARRGSSG